MMHNIVTMLLVDAWIGLAAGLAVVVDKIAKRWE
jgi:hypothetical protein